MEEKIASPLFSGVAMTGGENVIARSEATKQSPPPKIGYSLVVSLTTSCACSNCHKRKFYTVVCQYFLWMSHEGPGQIGSTSASFLKSLTKK